MVISPQTMALGPENGIALFSTHEPPTDTQDADLFAKVYPEISLVEEHQRQSLILARIYAERLGFKSAEAYIATLPGFPHRPDSYDALGLNVPLIVETRVPWLEAAALSDIYVTNYLKRRANNGKVSDWAEDNFVMPEVPITAWVQDGTKFVYREPSDVRNELVRKKEHRDYRAGRNLDAIAFANVRPDMVRTMFWDVIGNSVGSGRVPSLGRWVDQPGLVAGHVGNAGPDFRALVLGREFRTLNLAV